MRVGQNPAKSEQKVAQPAEITICVVNCIPILSGYFEQGLDVLKASLQSIWETTKLPYDLMVFDNHSCEEVRKYLVETYDKGLIQYLVLSEKNIGKLGAWNYMFGAAQGKFVAFSDSDVLFKTGWLEESLALFQAFPNVGMVTGRPLKSQDPIFEKSLAWAKKQKKGTLQIGQLQGWEDHWTFFSSVGMTEEKAREHFEKTTDYLVTMNGKKAYLGAEHFQFVASRQALQKVLPIPSEKPMRGEHYLDSAIDQLGYLRLNTFSSYVEHLGNTLDGHIPQNKKAAGKRTLFNRILWLPGIRHILLWIYNKIFHAYFYNVK